MYDNSELRSWDQEEGECDARLAFAMVELTNVCPTLYLERCKKKARPRTTYPYREGSVRDARKEKKRKGNEREEKKRKSRRGRKEGKQILQRSARPSKEERENKRET